jgi:hypothetical protein
MRSLRRPTPAAASSVDSLAWPRATYSHCHPILSRTSNASDGQIATLTDLGRPNRNPS